MLYFKRDTRCRYKTELPAEVWNRPIVICSPKWLVTFSFVIVRKVLCNLQTIQFHCLSESQNYKSAAQNTPTFPLKTQLYQTLICLHVIPYSYKYMQAFRGFAMVSFQVLCTFFSSTMLKLHNFTISQEVSVAIILISRSKKTS